MNTDYSELDESEQVEKKWTPQEKSAMEFIQIHKSKTENSFYNTME